VAAITFTTDNWSTLQTVTVTGVDDDVVDGNITFSVIVSDAISEDTNYNVYHTNYSGVDSGDYNVLNVTRGADGVHGASVNGKDVHVSTIDGRFITVVLNGRFCYHRMKNIFCAA
jgi:hypothetical protein